MPFHRIDVVQATNLNAEDAQGRLDDTTNYRWRLLSEGDSWFTVGAIPSSNLLYELELTEPAVLLNLGYPGDTISNISQLSRNREFARRLAHRNWASDWDAILMSAGGNDLIDRAFDLIVQEPDKESTPSDCVNAVELAQFCQDIERGYRRVVELRDSATSVNQHKPIIIHTYDYPTPRPSPANFLFVPITRPWLLPAFERRRVPARLHCGLADFLLDKLADTLLDLENKLPNFHVVDTRKTLVRANAESKGNSGDWLNEIHPNSAGYRKIAARLSQKIHSFLDVHA